MQSRILLSNESNQILRAYMYVFCSVSVNCLIFKFAGRLHVADRYYCYFLQLLFGINRTLTMHVSNNEICKGILSVFNTYSLFNCIFLTDTLLLFSFVCIVLFVSERCNPGTSCYCNQYHYDLGPHTHFCMYTQCVCSIMKHSAAYIVEVYGRTWCKIFILQYNPRRGTRFSKSWKSNFLNF